MRAAHRIGIGMMVLVLASWAQAQVMSLVPEDAPMVIKINNLKSVSDKIAVLAKAWGIDQMKPELADPLGSLQKQTNMNAGLNSGGEMAIVVTQFPQGRGGEPSMLLLIPVSDYQAFQGNFKNVKTEGEISTFNFVNDSKSSYMAHWGNYAAIGNRQESVAKKPAGLKVQGLAQQELDKKDIVVFGNLAMLRAKVLPQLQQNRQNWIQKLEADVQRNPQTQQYVPLVRALANQALDVSSNLMQDAQAATWGLNLSDKGITSTLMAEFTPNSKTAQQLGQLKNSDEPLLAGLPDTQYLFYGGMAQDPQTAVKLWDDLVGPASKQLAEMGEQGKMIQGLLDATRQQVSNLSSQTMGFVVPANPQGGVFQSVTVGRGNAPALVKGMKQAFQAQQQLMAAVQPQGQAAPTSVSVQENAKEVGGVKFDVMKVDVNEELAKTPQGAQAVQMMRMMYGPQGLNAYVGALDEKLMLTVAGGDDQFITQAIAAAKANQNTVGQRANVQAVSQQLPQKRIAAFYVPLDNIVSTALNYAKMFGMNINVQIKPNLEPIGVTVASEGGALRVDSYLSSELVQSLIAAGMQAAGQMQGARQPGGPEGL